MWQVCDTCGAIIFNFDLHAAWHATLKLAPHAQPDPTPTSTEEPH